MEDYKELFDESIKNKRITRSRNIFKIKLFLKKGENSLLIAKELKDKEPKKGEPEKLYWNYWAITVSYYSMFYAIHALLAYKGIRILSE